MRAIATGLLALAMFACGDGDPTRFSPDGAHLRATVENISTSANESEVFDGTAEFERGRRSLPSMNTFGIWGEEDVAGAVRKVRFYLFDLEPRPGQPVRLEAMNVDVPPHAGATVVYSSDHGRFLSVEGELLPEVVTEEEASGTFWFRAFQQVCDRSGGVLSCPFSPPEDAVWIRVEGQFVAEPAPPIIDF